MARPPPSGQTVRVLGALARIRRAGATATSSEPRSGSRPGSLYPILVRLSDRGLLEATLGGRAAGRATSPPPLPVDRTRTGVRRRASSRSRRRAKRRAGARARGRVIGGIFVLALVLLLVPRPCRAPGSLRRLTREGTPRGSGGAGCSRSPCGPAARAPPSWGAAMRAELAAVARRQARWRFSLSCRPRGDLLRLGGIASRDRGGGADPAAILAAVAGSLGLALFSALLRYPGLRTGVTVLGLARALPPAACRPTCSQARRSAAVSTSLAREGPRLPRL